MTEINEATLQDGSQTLMPLCISSTQLQKITAEKITTGGCKNQGKENEIRKGMSEEKLIPVDSDTANQLTVSDVEKDGNCYFRCIALAIHDDEKQAQGSKAENCRNNENEQTSISSVCRKF